MDIKISCKSFEADSGYNNSIDLSLNNIDFAGEDKSTYISMLREWFNVEDIVVAYKASELVTQFDAEDVLDVLDESEIAEYTQYNVNSDNLEDFVSKEVLELYAKRYIRDKKIEGII